MTTIKPKKSAKKVAYKLRYLYFGDKFATDKKSFFSKEQFAGGGNWISEKEIDEETGLDIDDEHISPGRGMHMMFDAIQHHGADIIFFRLPKEYIFEDEDRSDNFRSLLNYARSEAKYRTIIVLVPRDLPNFNNSEIPICDFARELSSSNNNVIMIPDCKHSIKAMRLILQMVKSRSELCNMFGYWHKGNKGITEYHVLFDMKNKLV